VLQAGALATLAGALRPGTPALAARPASLFEMDLDAHLQAAGAARAGGWQTTPVLRAPRRFDLIGLRWARGSHAEAEVRARRRGGRWTEWAPLADAAEHGPDHGRPVAGTDPAFVGAADEFQVRLRGAPRALRARFVRALPTATAARRLGRRLRRRRGYARAAQAGAPPPMIMRPEWGADAVPPREPPQYSAVHMALVHHTVNANDYGPEDSAGIVLGIARYHRDTHGWNDIGYNFLVDKYGQIFEGRAGGIDQAVVGAQAQGWNSTSTGIACIGDFTSVANTPEGMNALAQLIGWKLSVHGVPVQGTVTLTSIGGGENKYPAGTPVTFQRIGGHRDGCNTACPGNGLYGQLAALRVAAAQYAGTGLSIGTLKEIRGLVPVDISGALRFQDGSSAAGLPIALEFQAVGAYYEPFANVVTAADGTWRTTVTFPESGRVRAIFAGDAARGRLESLPQRVTVLAKLSVKVARRQFRFGKSFTVRGTAEPADTVRVVLQRRGRRRWVRERSRVLRVRKGNFKVKLRPRSRGRYRLVVQAGRVKRRRSLRIF